MRYTAVYREYFRGNIFFFISIYRAEVIEGDVSIAAREKSDSYSQEVAAPLEYDIGYKIFQGSLSTNHHSEPRETDGELCRKEGLRPKKGFGYSCNEPSPLPATAEIDAHNRSHFRNGAALAFKFISDRMKRFASNGILRVKTYNKIQSRYIR